MYLRKAKRYNSDVSLDAPVKSNDESDLFFSDIFYSECNIYDECEAESEKRMLYEVIETLDERKRKIIKSYYGLGCKQKNQYEIAETLGIAQGTVCRDTKHALKQMREKMEQLMGV